MKILLPYRSGIVTNPYPSLRLLPLEERPLSEAILYQSSEGFEFVQILILNLYKDDFDILMNLTECFGGTSVLFPYFAWGRGDMWYSFLGKLRRKLSFQSVLSCGNLLFCPCTSADPASIFWLNGEWKYPLSLENENTLFPCKVFFFFFVGCKHQNTIKLSAWAENLQN